ncbi:hypothetical protein [Plantactinospora sp. GCM10030261]|uniref:hypothetical protein n=1 Tax=Plantactinospora sp. GCM10030261 TaxID=3273420 RepID=UPI0036117910
MISMLALVTLPSVLVLLVGLALVLARRRRLRSLTWLVAGALVMLLVAQVGSTAYLGYLFHMAFSMDTDGLIALSAWGDAIGTTVQRLDIAGLLLLVIAVFMGRRPVSADRADAESDLPSVGDSLSGGTR